MCVRFGFVGHAARAIWRATPHGYRLTVMMVLRELILRGSARRRRELPRRALEFTLVLIVVSVLLLAGCSAERRATEGVIESHTEGTFYTLPSPLTDGKPGNIIRSERLLGAPDGSVAWRILYHSVDVTGADIGVSGIVVVPDRPAPDGGWPVMSWAHPTTGAIGRCAPSTGDDPFALIEGIHELLGAGFAVAATDYPGMGANGPPSYLIGASEGNSVLDAARAARAIPDAHVSDRLLLWGHSQGGQAALFAAQSTATYAPDLHVLGVAVAAPAVELAELLDDDIVDASGVTLGAYAFDAYHRVYGAKDPSVDFGSILTPAGQQALPQMAPLCLLGQNKELHAIADPLVGHFLSANPATVQPWSTLLAQNTPAGSGIGVPILVAQGRADTLVRPTTTDQYVQKLCTAGEQVEYHTVANATHAEIAEESIPTLIQWLSDRTAGRPPPTTCPPAKPN